MTQIIYGSCVEPGGMLLDDSRYECPCPECGGVAKRHDWQSVEGGGLNPYWSINCPVCGYKDGDYPASIDEFTPFGDVNHEELMAAIESYGAQERLPAGVASSNVECVKRTKGIDEPKGMRMKSLLLIATLIATNLVFFDESFWTRVGAGLVIGLIVVCAYDFLLPSLVKKLRLKRSDR